jgi:hypothetical protein
MTIINNTLRNTIARAARYMSIHLIARVQSQDDYDPLRGDDVAKRKPLITDKRLRRGARKSDNNNCE